MCSPAEYDLQVIGHVDILPRDMDGLMDLEEAIFKESWAGQNKGLRFVFLRSVLAEEGPDSLSGSGLAAIIDVEDSTAVKVTDFVSYGSFEDVCCNAVDTHMICMHDGAS